MDSVQLHLPSKKNDGTDAMFAKLSRSFRKFFEVFVGSETCLDLFGPSRMRWDTFGCARKHLEAFGRFWIFFKIFAIFFFALVPNTGEACDEMRAATAPIISEMCALRLENNNRLRR